jgi:ABC-type branched-subunit amino acid transport system ATPase component
LRETARGVHGEGEHFEPELIEAIEKAFADACATLGLKDKESDLAVRLVAQRTIEVARAGVHDPELLKAVVVKELSWLKPF